MSSLLDGANIAQISRAAFWSYAGTFLDRAVRFATFVTIARAVGPAQFGIVTISLLTVEALQALLDSGLATALLQRKAVAEAELDTAFFVMLASAFLAAGLLLAGGPMLAAALHVPEAGRMLQALAAVPVINALGAVHGVLITRDLGFRALAGRTAAASLLASAVAILLALAGFGAWALVARTILLCAVGTVAVWVIRPWRPSFRFDLAFLKTVAPMSLRLWGSALTGQVNGRGLDLYAATVLGAAPLGALRIAGQIVLLLVELTVGPLTAAGFVLMSRDQHDEAKRQTTFATLAALAAAAIFPCFFGLLVCAGPLLSLLFGDKWRATAMLIPFMCAAAPAIYVQLLATTALFAAGRADRMLHWSLLEAGLTILFGAAGAHFGLLGLAAAGVARLYCMMPLAARWLKRDAGLDMRALLGPALPSLTASTVMALLVWLIRLRIGTALPPLSLVVVLIASGFVAYVAMLPFSARPLWRHWRSGMLRGTTAIDAIKA
jgi:PST family polysaccharide transporter